MGGLSTRPTGGGEGGRGEQAGGGKETEAKSEDGWMDGCEDGYLRGHSITSEMAGWMDGRMEGREREQTETI